MATVNWSSHEFEVYTPNVTWNNVPGIYIFCYVTQQNTWKSVYVGQAESFASRLANHERWAEARRLGATHVHACAVQKQSDRDNIEKKLVRAYQPALNTHYR